MKQLKNQTIEIDGQSKESIPSVEKPMRNLPQKIYLNIGCDNSVDFKELSEVTWSHERINGDCIEYVLSTTPPQSTGLKNPLMEELRKNISDEDKKAIDDACKSTGLSLQECNSRIDQIIKRFKNDDYGMVDVEIRVKMLVNELFASQQQPQQMEWIRVEDRLPAEGGRYWCYVRESNGLGISYYQWNCSYNENKKRWVDHGHNFLDVTHWMPLPPNPE